MRLLVAGGARVDAGKTTFSAGLLAALDDAVGFKPRAGNDYWFDHDDVRAAIGRGRLYGKDVRRLAAESTGDAPPEALNPVHRLWRPTPGRTGFLGEAGRTFLVDRVTTPEGSRFVVNGRAAEAGLLPERLSASLPTADAVRVASVAELNERTTAHYLPAFERASERIRETETVVVESYGDIAWPVEGVDYDAVAVVEPSRVRIYDGGRYGRARQVASGSLEAGQLEERVGRVVEMIQPLCERDLPALSSEDRADATAIAGAYAPAYEALLGAV
ncbi:ATPase [Haloferacaceae archaeon DSL9]